ncbi:MAG: VOC family protein [Proteobacteria bacterium]|nr:VOC family protein [Pseudomonadota bacterium]
MTKKSPCPEGVAWVSPYLMVSDVDKAAQFYEKAFSFKTENLVPGEDGTTFHGEFKYQDQLIMLGKDGSKNCAAKSPKATGIESPMSLYLYCENVDDFYKHAVSAGAKSLLAPENMFWGDRMCRLEDPDGYSWSFATHLHDHQKNK